MTFKPTSSSNGGTPVADPEALTPVLAHWLKSHSLREVLRQEIHARPFPVARAPLRASFLAVLSGEGGKDTEFGHLARFCQQRGVEVPPVAASFFAHDFGDFELRWERHTEFFTYTFIQRGEYSHPFDNPPLCLLPEEWLTTLSGHVLVAINVALEPASTAPRSIDELHRLFENHRLIASRVVEQNATVWTALQTHSDGFGRIYIHDHELTDCRAGRLLQRLLEFETYRQLALLSLPLAREAGPQLTAAEQSLGQLIEGIASAEDIADERRLIKELSALASEVERIRARIGYRFSATRAYHAIVSRRVEELRETEIAGFQTIGEFLERRLPPAMQTCHSVHERANELSRRIAHASDMLRTRINLTLEAQNQELLASTNRHAQMQLWLQQTVEGLSVAAISYYVLGLLKYCLDALEASGWHLDHVLLTGLAAPLVVLAVWLGVRRIHHRLKGEDSNK